MKKTKVDLSLMKQFDGKTDAIIDGEDVYVKIFSIAELSEKTEPEEQKPEGGKKSATPKKPAAKVVDDTKTEATPAATVEPTAEVVTEEAEELSEIVDWSKIKVGEKVQVELNHPDYKDQLLGADVVKNPAGTPKERVYVKFHSDGETDYLREGDKVYPFQFKF